MLGHVIDSTSGYLPNKMEIGGAWNAHFEAYENTTAWVRMFLISSTAAALKRFTNSWWPMWAAPIMLRALSTGLFCAHASTESGEQLLACADAARNAAKVK